MDDKTAQSILLATIAFLFGWILYLIRKPQDMVDKKVEDVENALAEMKRDFEAFKKEIRAEISHMKDVIICTLRGKE